LGSLRHHPENPPHQIDAAFDGPELIQRSLQVAVIADVCQMRWLLQTHDCSNRRIHLGVQSFEETVEAGSDVTALPTIETSVYAP
jgi:hypothetical protein